MLHSIKTSSCLQIISRIINFLFSPRLPSHKAYVLYITNILLFKHCIFLWFFVRKKKKMFFSSQGAKKNFKTSVWQKTDKNHKRNVNLVWIFWYCFETEGALKLGAVTSYRARVWWTLFWSVFTLTTLRFASEIVSPVQAGHSWVYDLQHFVALQEQFWKKCHTFICLQQPWEVKYTGT